MITPLLFLASMFSPNQTTTVSPIHSDKDLPYSIIVEQAPFNLPAGIHSGVSALYHDKWLFLAGRTNGMHDFSNTNDNFPPLKQNTIVYVVDPKKRIVYSRPLTPSSTGLTQTQIDELSVTSPQYFQDDDILYICGGYGVETQTGNFNTKSALTAIEIPKLMKWVIDYSPEADLQKDIRQTHDPLLKVTGGYMTAVDNDLTTLLVFGQNFSGFYLDSSNGNYTQQVRRFKIIDNEESLLIQPLSYENPNPNYRRRDLNVVPVILNKKPAYVALSGVFTLNTGIWTVPVIIQTNGQTSMADPNLPSTFKQGMNNYTCPTIGLYSKDTRDMYTIICGGISYEYFQNGLQQDLEFPFINQITTVKIDKEGTFTQYLMNEEYPVLYSTGSNPGNQLLFGAGAFFIPEDHAKTYDNGVFKFDKLKDPTVLGYIVGGIMSTLPNTSSPSDSAASPYIFRVILKKN